MSTTPSRINTLRRSILAASLGTVFVKPAWAQDQNPLAYEGPDREQRLAEGARKEGALNIYTSMQGDDMAPLLEVYQKRYGIKANVWRSSSENVLQRTVTEARGNRFTADVVETNGPELEAISREKLFQQVKSPHLADIMPEAKRAHGDWVGTRLNVFVQAYNTGLVKKEELPQSWQDLANPRWKDKLGIEAEDQDWLAGVVASLGEEQGIQLFRKIVATNGMSVRKGHTLLAQLVVSGEIPLALTVYNYKVEQLRAKGSPTDWFVIGTPIGRPNGVGVARKAPNPHAAALFYDLEISEEGQQLLAKRNFVATNTKVKSVFSGKPMTFINPAMMLDDGQKWAKLYAELFSGGKGG
ncbi:MAG: extracellular solute-binding protein [Burkholderiaceae bacterium]|nr:extracellular solute-binding protein [Burkholderiaceae bacterium]